MICRYYQNLCYNKIGVIGFSNIPYIFSKNRTSVIKTKLTEISCMPELANETRQYLVQQLDKCGGHFSSNIGANELTIGMHYVYDMPKDNIVWDVGHQAYTHKILTGRRDELKGIRKIRGLSPFPKRSESPHDSFGTGHSGTSIGAALGMISCDKGKNVTAVVGDGGITGGMCFEALNHADTIKTGGVLVLLNDNNMSISNNVGALKSYLIDTVALEVLGRYAEKETKFLRSYDKHKKLFSKTKKYVSRFVQKNKFFQGLGIAYIGPLDGHNIFSIIKIIRKQYNSIKTKVVHAVTTKGRGYLAAEENKISYHATKPGFYRDRYQEKYLDNIKQSFTYSDLFGEWLCREAEKDPKLVAITPAMCEGSGMQKFSAIYRNRYFDVGIAEQHSMTFAAGIAASGKKPVVAVYSTFLQRAYDQVIHDAALQNLDITIAVDRSGLVGPDGPTHAGNFDISYMRCIPNIVIMSPSCKRELDSMLRSAYHYPGTSVVRYPKDIAEQPKFYKKSMGIRIGNSIYCRSGREIVICSFGVVLLHAMEVAEKINASVINMRCVKPLDKKLIYKLSREYKLIVTLEENSISGGAGSAINEVILNSGLNVSTMNLGVGDAFLEHGSREQMLSISGLDAKGILGSIRERIKL